MYLFAFSLCLLLLHVSSLLWFSSEASVRVFKTPALRTEISHVKKPNRSLQGLRIIGKVKYLDMKRQGGAQKKSFHPFAPY